MLTTRCAAETEQLRQANAHNRLETTVSPVANYKLFLVGMCTYTYMFTHYCVKFMKLNASINKYGGNEEIWC